MKVSARIDHRIVLGRDLCHRKVRLPGSVRMDPQRRVRLQSLG
ncbi:MAG: hypothetical protein V3T77_06950 [Planctomycetota bacterium]